MFHAPAERKLTSAPSFWTLQDDFAYAIGLDASANVYVTGESVGSGTGGDYSTIKYDNRGTQLWVARYNGPGNTFDDASAIALDGSGDVVVTGRSSRSGGSIFTTIKYVQV